MQTVQSAVAAALAAVSLSVTALGVSAQDETAKGYAFIETVLPARAPFVGEVFTVRLRAGVDVDVLEGNLVQLFRRPLDVPVQLDHPWFDGTPERPRVLGAAAPPAGTAETLVALGAEPRSTTRALERGRDGRRFAVLEFTRSFLAEDAGELECPAPRLAFAYALEFRDDLVAGRVPVDRHDAFVLGAASALTVRAVPEEGRPFTFTGAVGALELRAEAAPARVRVGETVTLVVAIEGTAPAATYALPRLDRFPGFEVQSRAEQDSGATERRVTLELVAVSAGRHTLPAIELAAFDPEAARFVEHRTEPFSVEVVGEPTSGPPAPPPAASGPRPSVIAMGAVAALIAVLWLRRRRA